MSTVSSTKGLQDIKAVFYLKWVHFISYLLHIYKFKSILILASDEFLSTVEDDQVFSLSSRLCNNRLFSRFLSNRATLIHKDVVENEFSIKRVTNSVEITINSDNRILIIEIYNTQVLCALKIA